MLFGLVSISKPKPATRVLGRRIHSELLILFFQNARDCAPRVFKVQFLVYSIIHNAILYSFLQLTFLTIFKVHQCLIEIFKYSDRYLYIWIETKNAIILLGLLLKLLDSIQPVKLAGNRYQ